MTAALKIVTDPNDIESRIAAATAKLETLRNAADDAAAEATRAEKAYGAHRTAELLLARTLTADLAGDARLAAEAHERDVLHPLLAEQKATERAGIAKNTSAEQSQVLSAFDAAADALVASVRQLDAAIAQLAAHHATRVRAQQAGVGVAPLSLERLIAQLDERLAPLRRNEMTSPGFTAHAHYTYGGGTDRRVVLAIERGAAAVATQLL